LGLESIADGLLDPISEISPIPTVAKDVAFEQRDPHIKVFLFNNRLWSFPVPLLNLEHLTVLSLRANRLVTLPPAISKLRNLEALNIAQNHLRFLPGELLSLLQPGSKLRTLNFHPNRFWEPEDPLPDNRGPKEYEKFTFGSRDEPTIESNWTGLTTYLFSRTPVHFTDSAGKTYSRFVLPNPESKLPEVSTLELEPFTSLTTPKQLAPELRSHAATSKVINPKGAKSLFELALHACAKSAQAESIPSWLREDEGWPAHFAPTVQRAVEIHRQGGVRCSVCGRETLLPLARWVEFRHIRRMEVAAGGEDGRRVEVLLGGSEGVDMPVPFLRVGCSWRCVPVKVELGKVEGEREGEELV
jgi:hypothetical protein